MADTLGGLIDKLITIDMKMWNNQEFLYEVRRLSYDEFEAKHTESKQKREDLFDSIKKCCDLNVQRNQLIDEIDEKIVEMLKSLQGGGDLDDGKFIQRKHKTY